MTAARRIAVALGFAVQLSLAVAEVDGRVAAVIDGDTIRVRDAAGRQHKIRLSGIDAPERAQPFGAASRRHLASLLAGEEVRVESSKTDRYGRLVGKVLVRPAGCAGCGMTLDANLEQIRAGMAWWYEYYADEQPQADRESYKAAVNEARRAGRGLWRDADAIPPWAWRRGARSPAREPAAADLRCGAKRFCREMNSCAEARFHLRECGLQSLDGNRDGLPCESLCR